MLFFGMWSLERFLALMQDGKISNVVKSFLNVTPAIIFHSASIAHWGCYFLIFMIWNVGEKRFMFQKKTGGTLLLGLLGIMFLLNTSLADLLLAYFGNDYSLYHITHLYFEPGGSDYLRGMDCRNWIEFVPFTLIRMFYFLFSPLSMDMRGIVDLLAFFMDGLPLFVIIMSMVYMMKKMKGQFNTHRACLITTLLGGLMMAFIFSWGVSNAGTAMRHRYLAWSIFIVGLCIAYGSPDKKILK